MGWPGGWHFRQRLLSLPGSLSKTDRWAQTSGDSVIIDLEYNHSFVNLASLFHNTVHLNRNPVVALQRPADPLPTPPSPELILWNTTHVIKTSSWAVLIQSYLFIGPFPETSHDEDHGHGRLQVGANGLQLRTVGLCTSGKQSQSSEPPPPTERTCLCPQPARRRNK